MRVKLTAARSALAVALGLFVGSLYGAAFAGVGGSAASPLPPPPPFSSPVFFAISVPDLEASIAWYEKHFDLTARRLAGTDQARVAILEGDGLMVEILEHADAFDLTSRLPDARSRYLVHGPFKVGIFVEGLDARVARLARVGARFLGETFDDPANGVRSALLLDNDGNIIQLFERID